MEYRQKLGNFGENLVVKYLTDRGYMIIARNVKEHYPEIDIIAKVKEKFVFIEVKTRVIYNNEPYEEVLSQDKIKNLKKGIHYYFNSIHYQPMYFRADLIVVEMEKSINSAKIKHYKDIF